MAALPTFHFLLVCVWLGVVLAETAVEFNGSEDADLLKAARIHYRIDTFIEIPLVLAVLVTGTILTIRMWPLPTLIWIKIGFGLAAILVNLYCAGLVMVRYKKRNDKESLRRLSRHIYQTWLGVPFGLTALYFGLRFMGFF